MVKSYKLYWRKVLFFQWESLSLGYSSLTWERACIKWNKAHTSSGSVWFWLYICVFLFLKVSIFRVECKSYTKMSVKNRGMGGGEYTKNGMSRNMALMLCLCSFFAGMVFTNRYFLNWVSFTFSKFSIFSHWIGCFNWIMHFWLVGISKLLEFGGFLWNQYEEVNCFKFLIECAYLVIKGCSFEC